MLQDKQSGKLVPYLSPSADTVEATSALGGNDGTLVPFPPSRFVAVCLQPFLLCEAGKQGRAGAEGLGPLVPTGEGEFNS